VVEMPQGGGGGTLGDEAVLAGVVEVSVGEVLSEAVEEDALKCLGEGVKKGDGAVGRWEVGRLVGLWKGKCLA